MAAPAATSVYPIPKSIAVVGAGHVGAPHAVMLAKKCRNTKVTIVDDDAHKVAQWNSSMLPFYEPGLTEMIEEVRGTNLFFSTDFNKAIADAEIILVSVNTPIKSAGHGANYAPDLSSWETMARRIAAASPTPKLIVERSTVPVKTADLMAAVLAANSGGQEWTVLSNPEFAREGSAMTDHASPERVLIGAPPTEAGEAAAARLADVYRAWVPESNILVSNLWSAELSKMTANAFLAQRISSINSISALCEKTGADVTEVAYAIGVDSRIGRKHLTASVGFGGACYETHLRNLVYLCKHYRLKEVAAYWDSVLKMNEWQKRRFAATIVAAMFNTVSGKRLAVFGFAYKKNTSDTRHTPARAVCSALLAERAQLVISDPRVAETAVQVALTDSVGMTKLITVDADPYMACQGAHAVIVMTEWDEYKRLDWKVVFESMQRPAFIFDGRNLLNHDELREIGFIVHAIGKPQQKPVMSAEEQEAAEIAKRSEAARLRVGAARQESEDTKDDGDETGFLHEGSVHTMARGLPTAPPSGPGIPRMNTFGALS